MEITALKASRQMPKVPRELLQKAEYLHQNAPEEWRERVGILRQQLHSTDFGRLGPFDIESELKFIARESKIDLAPKHYDQLEVPDVFVRTKYEGGHDARGTASVRIETLTEGLPVFQGELKEVSPEELDAFVERFDALSPKERDKIGGALRKQASKTKWGRNALLALTLLVGLGAGFAGFVAGIGAGALALLVSMLFANEMSAFAYEYQAKPSNPLESLLQPDEATAVA